MVRSPVRELAASIDAGLATVTIDRPHKRNAMSVRMWQALTEILGEIAARDDVRVLVLRGSGAHFCAGADIAEFERTRGTPQAAERYRALVDSAEAALAGLAVPTIAALRGSTIGGGLELALACDFRLMSETVRCGITASKLGLVYSAASTRRLAAIVGPAWAKHVLFTSQLMDAAHAARIGLAHDVLPEDRLDAAVQSLVALLIDRSALTIEAAKLVIDQPVAGAPEVDLGDLVRRAAASEFYRDRVAAFNAPKP
ncbi:enoyl-CoA hydratase-related protein [Cumulibacter manganitolerans]|uniref:enoyl-CoA hydratase-related protein n=1 Tax=Cumulibacter manganitolerans TaxID=1884992 RepID=UPI001294D4A4|nr:enoyl-CoA hydratase-related protein [Cumulibacter manganitolerans]